jgi:DNA-binding XRE family transcriptional regulator
MSQESLAADADVDRKYVQLLEKGTSTPSLDIFFRLTHALKIDSRDVVEKVESRIFQKEANANAGGRSANGRAALARGRPASAVKSRRRQNEG